MDVAAIISNGWLQGAILPPALNVQLASLLGRQLPADAAAIVLTQSCDVRHHGDGEPFVEVLIAEPYDGPCNGVYAHGRNPRILHFAIRVQGTSRTHKALAYDKHLIPRDWLTQASPDPERTLDLAALKTLMRWVIMRYEREAFPDAFNERIYPVKDKLKKTLEQATDAVHILVAISPDGEAQEGEQYRMSLLFVMRDEHFRELQRRQDLEKVLIKTQSLLENYGVVFEGDGDSAPRVVSEADVTLHDLRYYKRWGDFDYLSYRDPDHHESR